MIWCWCSNKFWWNTSEWQEGRTGEYLPDYLTLKSKILLHQSLSCPASIFEVMSTRHRILRGTQVEEFLSANTEQYSTSVLSQAGWERSPRDEATTESARIWSANILNIFIWGAFLITQFAEAELIKLSREYCAMNFELTWIYLLSSYFIKQNIHFFTSQELACFREMQVQ